MKPLQENNRTFTLLGICSTAKSMDRWKILFYIFVSISCPSISFIGLIASSVFFLRNFTTDLANTICVGYEIVAMMIALYSLIIAHIKRDDLKRIFDDFQDFYNTSK